MKCGVESVKCEVNQVLNGSSPSSLYAVRLLILLQRAQLLRCFQTELKRRTCIVSNLSLACAPTLLSILPLWLPGAPTSDWLPWGGRSWSQNCLECVSTLIVLLLVLVLRTGPTTGNCVSQFVCLIAAPCIFAFLLEASLGRRFSRLSYPTLHSRDCTGPVFFPTGLPTWLSICLPSCGGFATGEFLRFACFERYHSVSLVAAMRLTYVIW